MAAPSERWSTPGYATVSNALALVARTGLYQAFDLRRDRPDLWMQLTTTGATSLKVTADDLPYFTSSRAIAIQASRFVAKVKGAPATFALKVDGVPTALNAAPPGNGLAGLVTGTTAAPLPLDTAKSISTTAFAQLEEMIVVIQYVMN